mgnify:CR=1 FL=1
MFLLTAAILVFIFAAYASAAFPSTLHINLQTTDSGGTPITGTFAFNFNISSSSSCNQVLYSNYTTLITDSRGIISYTLANVNLNFSDIFYLCYYRDGVLKSNNALDSVPYAFRAKNTTWAGIDDIPALCYSDGSGCVFSISGVIGAGYIINSTVGSIVTLTLNETLLNNTIDNRVNANKFYYNQTAAAINALNITKIRIVDTNGRGEYGTIADAAAASSSGDTILVSPGIYAETVIIPVNVSLIGYGQEISIISVSVDDTILTLSGNNYVSGLSVDNTFPTGENPAVAIGGTSTASNVIIKDVSIRGDVDAVSIGTGNANWTFDGVLFDRCGWDCGSWAGKDTIVRNSKIVMYPVVTSDASPFLIAGTTQNVSIRLENNDVYIYGNGAQNVSFVRHSASGSSSNILSMNNRIYIEGRGKVASLFQTSINTARGNLTSINDYVILNGSRSLFYLNDFNAPARATFLGGYVLGNNSIIKANCLLDGTNCGINSTWNYNQTEAAIADINSRFYNRTQIDLFNNSWTTTFNSTYANVLNQQCPSGQVVNGTLSNGTFTCVADGGGNPFNQVLNTTSNVTFNNITVIQDITISGIRVLQWLYNQTIPAIDDINSRFWNRTQSYNKTEIDSFNASWTSTYNSTYAAGVANNSWNQTLASSLYVEQSGDTMGGFLNHYTAGSKYFSSDNTTEGSIFSSNNAFTISMQKNPIFTEASNLTLFHGNLTGMFWNPLKQNINNYFGNMKSNYAIFIDAKNNRTGFNTQVPNFDVEVNGTFSADNIYNKTQIDNFNNSWTTTYNATYNNLIAQQCPAGQIVNGTLANGTFTCIADANGGGNATFNQSLTDNLYVPYNGSTTNIDLNGRGIRNLSYINITANATQIPIRIVKANGTSDSISVSNTSGYQWFRVYETGGVNRMSISYGGNGRTILFDPANGALDSVGTAFMFNRFSGLAVGIGLSSASILTVGDQVINPALAPARFYIAVASNSTISQIIKLPALPTTDVFRITNFSGFNITTITNKGDIFAGNVSPVTNNTYSLGTSEKRWNSAYVINITTGDIIFNNGLILREPDSQTLCLFNQSNARKVCFDSDGNITLMGNVKFNMSGGGIYMREGANATSGVAVLTMGSATVLTNKVTANSRIRAFHQETVGTVGVLSLNGRVVGESFTIASTGGVGDSNQFHWEIIEPT